MWLGKQQRRVAEDPAGNLGEVTISGTPMAVRLDSERRQVTVCAPGGYAWRPLVGQEALVVRTGEGELYAAGVVQREGTALEPGEVALSSAGGAEVRLGNSGAVELRGRVTVNGVPLEQTIRAIALELLDQTADMTEVT